MLIPFTEDPTPEEKYQRQVRASLKKAEHLSKRLNDFKNDLSRFKGKDQIAICNKMFSFVLKDANDYKEFAMKRCKGREVETIMATIHGLLDAISRPAK